MCRRSFDRIIRIYAAASFIWLYAHHAIAAESQLNGIAAHHQLGREIFLAGLYVQTPTTDAQALIDRNERKAMELRIKETLHPRKFQRMWLEGIAINVAEVELEAHKDSLARFVSLVRYKLEPGDVFRIERDTDEFIAVSLNDQPLTRLRDDGFFGILMRAWLGPVPPSSDFKEDLLAAGVTSTARQLEFKAVQPDAARVQAIVDVISQSEQDIASGAAQAIRTAGKVSSQANRAAAADKSPQITAARPTVATAVAGATIAATTNASASTTNASTARALSGSEPQLSQSTNGAAARFDTEGANPRPNTQLALAPISRRSEIMLAAPVIDHTLEITADDVIAEQRYISDLIKWASRAATYPPQSLRKGREGTVKLAVVIDAVGKVKQVTLVGKTNYSDLNKAAVQAIKNAAPYPPIPSGMELAEYEFDVPVVYKIAAP